jgi:hypothetical protein
MTIAVVYVCVTKGVNSYDYAARFVGGWLTFPPGVECELVIACNGGPLEKELAMLFAPLNEVVPCLMMHRNNDESWDLGAFQEAARRVKCDMLVCMGESVHFHKPNWLIPIVEAWNTYGPGMYGFFSSNLVRAHMNTTAFACSPKDLVQYPRITKHRERYEFEHGITSLWRRLHAQKKPTLFVAWDGIYGPEEWRKPANILWRGDQSNLLVHANHTDRWFAANADTRFRWSVGADAPYK